MRESESGPLPSLSSPAFGRFGLDMDPLGEVVGEARLTAPTTRLAKRTGLLELVRSTPGEFGNDEPSTAGDGDGTSGVGEVVPAVPLGWSVPLQLLLRRQNRFFFCAVPVPRSSRESSANGSGNEGGAREYCNMRL